MNPETKMPVVTDGSLSEAKKQELGDELKEFARKVEEMNLVKQKVIESLYETASYLDKVWLDCRIASVAGNSAGIVGGVLTIVGGIATVLTAGAATPLLIAGFAVGAAGAGTNLGTAAAEAAINSTQIQEVEKALQGAQLLTEKVKEKIQEWKDPKNTLRLVFLAKLAVVLFGKNHIVVILIQGVLISLGMSVDIIKTCAETAVKTASQIATKAGAGAAAITTVQTTTGALVNTASKALVDAVEGGTAGVKAGASTIGKAGKAGATVSAKAAGGVIIGVSAVFVVWDAVDLGFNIRDLVINKGCDAAPYLREKAKELESSLGDNITSHDKE